MAEDVQVNIPMKFPDEALLTLSSFQSGVVTLVDQSNLPPTALSEATNIMLYEKGSPGPRWGTNWYGAANPAAAALDGGFMYRATDGANHLVTVARGNIYRSIDDGATWTLCTGATFTAGKKAYAQQGSQSSGSTANYLFLSNGYDYPIRYDGSTTLIPFVAISPPGAVGVVATSLSTGVYANYYRVAAVNNVGVTQASASTLITTATPRASWDPTSTGSHYMTLSWTAVTGAVRYDIFIADNATDDAANNNYYIGSVGATASPGFVDNGQPAAIPSYTAPIQNTTGAPRVREFTAVGSRLYGTQDRDFPYRVWFSGSGPFLGYFADAYDGGYIDLQRGSQYFPVKVADYRDGKDNPLATIWCDSADTQGCTWQMTLQATTLLNTQFTQPSANKLPGSRGTRAPNSVVNVLNDFLFFNYQAVYNMGPRVQFLNLLSTDESSADIRPTLVQGINPAYTANIAAYYYLAKVFISVPLNSTTNNTTMVYDTERKAWIPNAYSLGMERMFQYTDSSGKNHLLFWKPGDTKLSETSASITGDYGVAFPTSLTTGLIPTQPKDRFGFSIIDMAEVEFSNAQGGIYCELLGIDRVNGFASQKTILVEPVSSGSSAGWTTAAWSTMPWSDSTVAPKSYSEASSKRYFIANKELNAYQWHITTNSNISAYVLRTLQLSATPTNAGLPQSWRVTPL